MTLLGVGDEIFVTATTSSSANPQLNLMWDYANHGGQTYGAYSQNTYSFIGVQFPVSINFNHLAFNVSARGTSVSSLQATINLGLYSLNAGTLSLANSASGSFSHTSSAINSSYWVNLATSATQNISPGMWWLGYGITAATLLAHTSFSLFVNSAINPGNANPYFNAARMTVSTASPPTSVATSDLNITGSTAWQQAYIIITA